MSNKPTYVYLIGRQTADGLSGPIKVGIADNLKHRLRALQTGSHHALAIIAAIALPERRLAAVLEKSMHAALGADRLVGEWFDVTPFQAAGILCWATREMLERAGGSGEELLDVLEWTGTTDLMGRWMQEQKRRSH